MSKTLPPHGREHAEILKQMSSYRQGDADWHKGKTWSMVYYAGDDHHDFLKRAHQLFFAENALNPMAFKSLKRMEHEVVQMTARMLSAPASAVGTMTSGGTESILVMVQAYRDRARAKRPWIRRPNLVAPVTIHPAFAKAAHYFGVALRLAPVDENGQVDVRKLRGLVNRNTILIAASAPQYAHGVIDPIEEIGEFAKKRKIPFHVDGCFGGYIQPWLERLGVEMPVFDFRVEGVTSMSADTHKYGYAPKGASVVVYRDMTFLRHQFFVSTYWPGGIYISPSMQGTRPGGAIAAAWASMQAMGEDGYLEKAKDAYETAQELRAGIGKIDGIRVLGLPHSTIVTWAADDCSATKGPVDVFAVADLMAAKGWALDRQQDPPSIHCTVNAWNRPRVPEYLSDLAEAVDYARAHPELSTEGEAATYGLMAKVPLKGVVSTTVRQVMEQMYAAEGDGIPELSDSGPMPPALMNAAHRVLDVAGSLRAKARGFFGKQG